MNRKDVAKAIAEYMGTDRKLADQAITCFFDIVTKAVSEGERVVFTDFGVFAPTVRGARKGRNPHTNEAVDVPERVLPRFRPAKAFKAQVAERLEVRTVES